VVLIWTIFPIKVQSRYALGDQFLTLVCVRIVTGRLPCPQLMYYGSSMQ
jgi:hypothetical protein